MIVVLLFGLVITLPMLTVSFTTLGSWFGSECIMCRIVINCLLVCICLGIIWNQNMTYIFLQFNLLRFRIVYLHLLNYLKWNWCDLFEFFLKKLKWNYITKNKLSFLTQAVLRRQTKSQVIITIGTYTRKIEKEKHLAFVQYGKRTKPPPW